MYLAIGIGITIIAISFSFIKVPSLTNHYAVATNSGEALNIDHAPQKKLFKHKHFVCAVAAQFFNVAAQSGTWAFFINYGHEVMGFEEVKAGNFLVLFMVMMLLGRFAGTFLMRFIAPNKLLAAFALFNILMCVIVAQGFGWASFTALLMINFFFGIMYPTIFSLGIKNLGKHTEQASSFISMGVVGGAFFPIIMGLIADHDVAKSYYLLIVCYMVIFYFGFKFQQLKNS